MKLVEGRLKQHPISSCNLIFSNWATPSPLWGCFGFSELPLLLLLDDDGDDDGGDDPVFVSPA